MTTHSSILAREFHEQRNLVGYSPWTCKESDMTEQLTLLLLLLRRFSRVPLCAIPQTASHQPPLSLGFSRQEYWSGLPWPTPLYSCSWLKIFHYRDVSFFVHPFISSWIFCLFPLFEYYERCALLCMSSSVDVFCFSFFQEIDWFLRRMFEDF